MQDLKYISYVEEQNGIAEAVYLLEERLKSGGADKVTVLRLLFLYWFMEHEPAFFTNDNGSRDWTQSFRGLLEQTWNRFKEDSEYNWVAGYLLSQFPAQDMRRRGEEMQREAVCLEPDSILPDLFLHLARKEKFSLQGVHDLENRLADWGMLGDYLRHTLAGLGPDK